MLVQLNKCSKSRLRTTFFRASAPVGAAPAGACLGARGGGGGAKVRGAFEVSVVLVDVQVMKFCSSYDLDLEITQLLYCCRESARALPNDVSYISCRDVDCCPDYADVEEVFLGKFL